jgi:A/G-specific adenine glycosylase
VTRRRFTARLFRWHATSRRPLAIRDAESPWQVLVAEVMSQQTGIERVGQAWRSFVDRWPTPGHLAGAPTHDLLAAWAGLGYNRRALALREAARKIVADHGSRVPASVDALEGLPGIGPYTARAVAASAFGVPVAPLDVNVRRVVSRVLGVAPNSANLADAADALVSRAEPRRWVDAVMDLAALVCTPRTPSCDACPLAVACLSRSAVATSDARANGGATGGATIGADANPVVARKPRTVPFPATSRWLRGRLLAAITSAPAGTWVPLPDTLGLHDAAAIEAAARALDREGFLDVRAGAARVRA